MSVLRLQALEVNAVHHCNLSCVGCSHASPVSPKRFAVPSEVYRDFAGLLAPLWSIMSRWSAESRCCTRTWRDC